MQTISRNIKVKPIDIFRLPVRATKSQKVLSIWFHLQNESLSINFSQTVKSNTVFLCTYLFAEGTQMKILSKVLQPLRKSVPLVDRQKPATICFEVSSTKK